MLKPFSSPHYFKFYSHPESEFLSERERNIFCAGRGGGGGVAIREVGVQGEAWEGACMLKKALIKTLYR